MEKSESRQAENSPDSNNGKISLNVGDAVTFDDLDGVNITRVDDFSRRIKKEREDVPSSDPLEAKEVSKRAEEVRAQKKMHKAFLDGKHSELDPETKFEVFVDKKPFQVSLADLSQNYSGKISYEKKFQDLSNQRNSFLKEQEGSQKESADVRGLMGDVYAAIETKNIDRLLFTASRYMGLSDADAEKAVSEYYSSAVQKIKQFELMSPEAREASTMKQRLDMQLHDIKRQRDEIESEKSSYQMKGKVDAILKAEGASEEEFKGYFDQLKDLQDRNPNAVPSITPEVVADYRRTVMVWSRAYALSEIEGASESEKSSRAEIIHDIIAQHPDFTDNDILGLFSDEPQNREPTAEEAKILQAKIHKNQPHKTQGLEAKPSVNKWASMTFDDLG